MGVSYKSAISQCDIYGRILLVGHDSPNYEVKWDFSLTPASGILI